jgi:hypothetical protein
MDTLSTLSLALGSSWLSGLNAYATIGILGLLGWAGWVPLPDTLHPITHPLVFGTALFLYGVEFIADKVPAFDTVWDSIQTFIRIPAGAFLAWASVGQVSPEWKAAAALLGGSLAFSAHTAKSSIRASANLSPEPFSNWILSLSQDGFILLCLYFMLRHPYLMLGILFVFLIFFIWFIPKIFRTFRWMFRKFLNLFQRQGPVNQH